MTELMRFLWLIALEVALVALLALCDAMLPGALARTRRTLVAQPGWSFVVGLVNVTFFGVVAAALLAPGGVIALIGGTIATALLALIAIGLAAAARIVGERLRPEATDPLRQLLTGGAALVLAASVPLVGWFVVLPFAGLAGFGAFLIGLVQRRAAPAAPPVAPPNPPPATGPPPLPWQQAPPQGPGGREW